MNGTGPRTFGSNFGFVDELDDDKKIRTFWRLRALSDADMLNVPRKWNTDALGPNISIPSHIDRVMPHYVRTWLRQRWFVLGLILGIATVLRLAALFGLRASIYRDYLFTDERVYDAWANDLAQAVPRYWCNISPLPAYYMAVIYRLFGVDPICVRYANLVLGVTTCWVLFGIGRRVGGTLVGLLSAFVAAVYRPFVFLSITALKEPLVLLVYSLMVFFFLGELKRHRLWRTLCVGVSAGLLSVLRPNACTALLIIAPMLASRARGKTRAIYPAVLVVATLAAGFLVPAGPFMVKNYLVAGQLSPAPQGGIELYLGNHNAGLRPYYTPAQFATPGPEEQGIDFRIEASRRAGRQLTFAQASSYWAHQVATQATKEPFAFTYHLLRKSIAALQAFEEGDNHSLDFLGSVIPFLRFPLLSYWLVMPLGMAGLIAGTRRYRGALPLLLVVMTYEITLVLFYCNLRLRVPLLIVLIPFASAGLVTLMSTWKRQRSWGQTFLAIAVALVLFEHIPLSGGGDLTSHYNTHAALLMEKGNEREALAYWLKSKQLKGAFSDFATLSLAQRADARGEAHEALAELASISDDSIAAAFKYDLLGDVLRHEDRPLEAVNAYEKALSSNSARRDTRQKLIVVYEGLGSEGAMRHQQVLRYIESFFEQ